MIPANTWSHRKMNCRLSIMVFLLLVAPHVPNCPDSMGPRPAAKSTLAE